MLDAETRRLIAPRLAAFRRTSDDLDANRRQLTEVTEALAGRPAAGGLFGGRPGATARRPRELRSDQRMLAAAIDEQETYAEQLAELIDELLHPVLRRTDGHYQRLLATALLFGDAVGHCDAVSGHLDAAVGAARVVSKAVMGKTVNPAAQFQADLAAQRYGDHMRRAGNGIKALPEHIAETERRASVLIRAALPPVPIPDLTGFDALPRTLGNTGARLRIAYSIGLLRTLEAQVLGVTAVLRRRQDLADRKRRAALRAAYDRL